MLEHVVTTVLYHIVSFGSQSWTLMRKNGGVNKKIYYISILFSMATGTN